MESASWSPPADRTQNVLTLAGLDWTGRNIWKKTMPLVTLRRFNIGQQRTENSMSLINKKPNQAMQKVARTAEKIIGHGI